MPLFPYLCLIKVEVECPAAVTGKDAQSVTDVGRHRINLEHERIYVGGIVLRDEDGLVVTVVIFACCRKGDVVRYLYMMAAVAASVGIEDRYPGVAPYGEPKRGCLGDITLRYPDELVIFVGDTGISRV